VVIIINRGSASASEVVSAVLQERGRATITGESSFGKNTVQQQFSLSNGGAFKLTIARWVTPDLHDFGGDGVIPDVEEDYSAELDVEAVARRAAATN
jgi:carboxyl-terminal processing protease